MQCWPALPCVRPVDAALFDGRWPLCLPRIGSAQRFLNIHSATYNTFYHQRHLIERPMYKELRTISFDAWRRAGLAA
jgi:hypothetical protein